MKVADDTYREWDTCTDEWTSVPLDREDALSLAVGRAAAHSAHLTPEQALHAGEETLRFVDKHLCSCRARLGETVENRNGTLIALGTGPLAYHFDSYEDVARYCRSQQEKEADAR